MAFSSKTLEEARLAIEAARTKRWKKELVLWIAVGLMFLAGSFALVYGAIFGVQSVSWSGAAASGLMTAAVKFLVSRIRGQEALDDFVAMLPLITAKEAEAQVVELLRNLAKQVK